MRCHAGQWRTAECRHILEECPTCGGKGWVQEDVHRPGVRCEANCDEGLIAATELLNAEMRYYGIPFEFGEQQVEAVVEAALEGGL